MPHNVLGILVIFTILFVSLNLPLPFGTDLVLQAWLNQILIVTLVIVLVSYAIIWMGTKKKPEQKKGGHK